MNSQGLEATKVLLEATEDVDSDTKVPSIGIKGTLRRSIVVPEVLNVIPEERVKKKKNFRMPVKDDTFFR